jgi:hypothetical protein
MAVVSQGQAAASTALHTTDEGAEGGLPGEGGLTPSSSSGSGRPLLDALAMLASSSQGMTTTAATTTTTAAAAAAAAARGALDAADAAAAVHALSHCGGEPTVSIVESVHID